MTDAVGPWAEARAWTRVYGGLVFETPPRPLTQPRPGPGPLTTRLRPWHWVLADAVVAVVWIGVLASGPGPQPEALLCVLALSMTARRIHPAGALAVAQTAACTLALTGHGTLGFLSQAYVIYLAPLRLSRPAALAAFGAVAVTTVAAIAAGPAPPGAPGEPFDIRMFTVTSVSAAAWTVGRAVHQHRAYTAGLREQAERRMWAEVAEERLRIARELHDVIAHGMSLIAVQAGMANHVIGKRPEEAARALTSIEETSRAALTDIRRLVGILRTGDPALEPAPGLRQLDRLVDSAARAGVRVDLRIHGEPRALPAGVEVAAYRVVQEAVTNVIKHARTDSGRVVLTYEPDAIRLEIADAGRGHPVHDHGHGLTGMRERVGLYGGEFDAGPLPGGRGFRVTARLPG